MARSAFSGPSMTLPAGRRGLTRRLRAEPVSQKPLRTYQAQMKVEMRAQDLCGASAKWDAFVLEAERLGFTLVDSAVGHGSTPTQSSPHADGSRS